jgi:hypothetical protein
VQACSQKINVNACVARGNSRAGSEPQNPLDYPISRFKARIQRKNLNVINYLTSFYAVARSAIRHEIFVRQKQKRMGYLPEEPKILTQISRVTHRQP